MNHTLSDSIYGTIYGTAFGDSWGFVTEFMKHKKILALNPLPPYRAIISDDTQMSLYNIQAVKNILEVMDVEDIMLSPDLRDQARNMFAKSHIQFYYDENNDRAPGLTCMNSLNKLIELSWSAPTGREGALGNNSKGCGSNMRAMWLGLLPFSDSAIATLAIIQAETTHDHHTSGVTAAVTALLTKRILQGQKLHGDRSFMQLTLELLDDLESGALGWHAWSDRLIEGIREAQTFFTEKVDLYFDLLMAPDDSDMNNFMGEGWVSDSALANATAAADLYGSNPYQGVKRLVFTRGDSDSIAAIGGAYLGAYNGKEWLNRFEERLETRYRFELAEAHEYILSLHKA